MKFNGVVLQLSKNKKPLNTIFGEATPPIYTVVYFLRGGLTKQAEIFESRIGVAREKLGIVDDNGFPEIGLDCRRFLAFLGGSWRRVSSQSSPSSLV